jgi:hypothetical protein
MEFWARVASDNNDITNEMGSEIKLISPCGKEISIIAVSRDVAQLINPEFAVPVVMRNINARISISDLAGSDYPFKSNRGDITLAGHKVGIQYPNGEVAHFEITEFHPDRFFDNINLVLDKQGQRPQLNNTNGRYAGK